MDGERGEVVGEARRGRGEVRAELADEDPQPTLGLGGAGRSVERCPVRGPDPGVEGRTLGQLGQDVAQAMDVMPTSA